MWSVLARPASAHVTSPKPKNLVATAGAADVACANQSAKLAWPTRPVEHPGSEQHEKTRTHYVLDAHALNYPQNSEAFIFIHHLLTIFCHTHFLFVSGHRPPSILNFRRLLAPPPPQYNVDGPMRAAKSRFVFNFLVCPLRSRLSINIVYWGEGGATGV